jgi:hypothetical protein
MVQRVVPNRRTIAGFLKTPEVRALIERKVRAVEQAAGESARSDGWRGEFRVDIDTGEHRVRGAVIGDYSTPYSAVSRRALLRGLDAARGAG